MKSSETRDGQSRGPCFHEGGGNVLLLSMRRVHDLVAFCAPYEFEDVIRSVTGADRVEPWDYAAVEWARRGYKAARKITGSRRLARAIAPRAPTVRLTRNYDLFLPVFNNAFELFALASIPDWRARCRTAACFVSELWARDLPDYLVEMLAEFDHIFVGVQHPTEEAARISGRPCTYLPLAADVTRFAPQLMDAPRFIDVCNIGRRSAVTHDALIRLARDRRIFYYYDTVVASGTGGKQLTFRVGNASEHRLLLASLLQRSRFFFAYRSRINEPEFTDGKDEISGRFYEGIAAGAILVGEAPRTEEFRRQFDWPDAVFPLPFDSPDVANVLAALDADPDRLDRARRRNVRSAALRHDWLHRLKVVFDAAGLPPTPGMLEREQVLHGIARM